MCTLICTVCKKAFYLTFLSILTTMYFVYTTMALGQLADLSKEACLCAAADRLSSSVSQRVARVQFQGRKHVIMVEI